jgi:phenylalanyl-tRNA synthetase alpha chain
VGNSFVEELNELKSRALAALEAVGDAESLEAVRIEYLGRNGQLVSIMSRLGALPKEERPEAGKQANLVKNQIQQTFQARLDQFTGSQAESHDDWDPSLPGVCRPCGALHPIRQVSDRIAAILSRMGFAVASGPDIETVYNNFDALNTPPDHPSRDPLDTFYLPEGTLLRTQTSPVQIRAMLAHKPPVRIIAPGRCYRRDTPDATHSATFHQVEGLYVDRDVSMADLKGTIAQLARELMGPSVHVRFRPHFFPFTEPSVECDFSCTVCGGSGCRVCKYSGWLEIAGAGMVDPRVFEQVGYDPEVYTGFAFGMGIERIAMIMHGIDDIRLLYENDTRFIDQFRMRFHENLR